VLLITVRRRLEMIFLGYLRSCGSPMAIPENPPNTPEQNNPSEPRRLGSDYCLASGLRRKFLDFCDENPGAEECRVYDL